MKKRQSKYTKICFTPALNLLSVTLSIYNKSVTDSDIIAFLNNAKTFLYFQTLHLSKESLLEFSTGHVIDLVSNDVQRLEEDTFIRFFYAPFAFLKIVLTTLLVVFFIGWQALMGVIFLCLLLPYFIALSYAGAALRLRTAAISDLRLSLMNQIVTGIRSIKIHAWEDEYREKVKTTRR